MMWADDGESQYKSLMQEIFWLWKTGCWRPVVSEWMSKQATTPGGPILTTSKNNI
jgi:hypothetical protein